MNQPNLFRAARPAPTHRPSSPAFVRKHLNRILNIASAAERMPWTPADAEKWAELFPRLAQSLPAEEGDTLQEAFATELIRLKALASSG